MPLNPADISVRGQNIGVLEGARGRTLQEQLADQQEALANAQMAQQYKMFSEDMSMKEKLAADAAEQARQDRLYGLIAGGMGGLLGAGGSMLGAYVGKRQ